MIAKIKSLIYLLRNCEKGCSVVSVNAISEAESILHHAMHAIDNPAISALTCTPDYLGDSLEPTEKSLNDLEEAYDNYMSDTTKGKTLIRAAVHGAYFLSLYLIYAKSTSNTSTDIGLADSKFIS